MLLDHSEMTLEEVLCTYSSVKGHHTRCEREIQNLLALLNTHYSSTSETRIKDRLEHLEKHTHKLFDITDYLLTLKYTKARDHQEDIAEFLQSLSRISSPTKFPFALGRKNSVHITTPHICTQQQAYLNNCLDDAPRARVDREVTSTTPVLSLIHI